MRNLYVILEAAHSVALEHPERCECLACRAAGGDAVALAALMRMVQDERAKGAS